MGIKYDYLEKINVSEIIKSCTEKWSNQSFYNVNSSVFEIGIFEEKYHLHKHDSDDELFFIIDGSTFLETENGSFDQGNTKGYVHLKFLYTVLSKKKKTIILMIENTGIEPIGNE